MRLKKQKKRAKLSTKINAIVLGIILLFSIVVGAVVVLEVTSGIKGFAVQKAKGDLSLAYRYIKNKYQGDWEIKNGNLYKGSTIINENYDVVDKIGEDTGDTVTIFQGETRVSTNVFADGNRAIGTKVSPEVAEIVLKNGKNYYGQAEVNGNLYQTAYMPLKDGKGETIGIFYVGASQKIVDETISSFLTDFIIAIVIVIMIATFIVFWFTRRLKKRLHSISSALTNAGNGDFTTEVSDHTGDELTDLSDSYNAMKENLSNMIQQVMQTSEQVAASSQELTAGSEQTSKASEQITESIQQVASGADTQNISMDESAKALEEVTIGIMNIAERSSTISESGAQASQRAKEGGEYVERTVQQINTINSAVTESVEVIKQLDIRSKHIDEITKVINDIANQTNLLALNAAIEAARAGEHGKGFAVVADEVRKLAEQSQQSSAQITDLISEIQKEMARSIHSMDQVKQEVKEGLGIVELTHHSFKGIIVSMDKIGEQIDDMAATAQQMSASAEEVSATVAGIKTISQETSIHSQSVVASTEEQLGSMEEIAASANALSEMAADLQELLSKFKVN